MSDGPDDLPVDRAVDRFLRKRQTDSTDRTLRSYESRLQPFIEWCEANEIETLNDLTAWQIDEYDLVLREQDHAPTTIKGHLSTLRVFLKYAANVGIVDHELPEAIDVPTLDRNEEQSEELLSAEDATSALAFFRDSKRYFGVSMHAFLEVAWHTGARMGGLRALDLEDYDEDDQSLYFRHRPSSDTPLKNKAEGERLVGIADPVCEALDTYIVRERADKRDEYGREPLFCGRQGRPSFTTLRSWSYRATQPCLWTECPHGRRRSSCEWTERRHASKCPSSRSPHRVRTGSITWQLNRGLSIEIVAERVNATPSVIRQYYDQATAEEEFEKRRRAAETALDIDRHSDQ
ncbi:site-specific integrase [Halomicrobium sp. IBSBa]|uniref:Tyrosine-type recombinase/integrase n=1 Tax=Halomicrobium mukohataei TaxID=57705 RepID=A0A847UHH7_9EURY|nr:MULTISPECIES: site-specific integrase [Halomicrobium]MBO4248409.1 site-specific integrase [Halomicrobium sp. IBSBa]NLV10711.1 tyrosine-type recombinase/integrase [Halomicrobium mukohataei]